MNGLTGVMAAAGEVETFCRSHGWRFCFIGGIAVQRWGTPRFTQDVDLTLFTGFGSEAQFVDTLLQHFSSRTRTARQFALERRVLLARTASGVDLDFALGAFPLEEDIIKRATPWHTQEGPILTTCSAEDLVIHKVFAGRARDWADVESVLARQHGRLNLADIRRQLPALLELKEETESLEKFERLAETVNRRLGK